MSRRLAEILVLTGTLISALLPSACLAFEHGGSHAVYVDNATAGVLVYLQDGREQARVKALDETPISLLSYDGPALVEIKDLGSGSVCYSETLSWDDLKQMDWRIRIESCDSG